MVSFAKLTYRCVTPIPLLIFALSAVADEPQLGKDTLDSVIAAMTLDEKISTVIGVGMIIPGYDLGAARRAPDVERPSEKVPGAAGFTFPIPRLGIPSLTLADGPAGLRIQPLRDNAPGETFYCTAFPIATLLASTWDTHLVERVGEKMGKEAKEYGVDVLLAPALNIHRYPLGGRNFEYFSEDPLISGKMAAAIVKGVQSAGVGTSLKHFVANNHEWNRYVIDIEVDERALREIYLRGFELAVEEGQPWTVMSSYNKVNGTYTSENERLLTDILRRQWGFGGFVMTDWFAGQDAVAQITAGNDMLMPGTITQQNGLRKAVQSGELPESILDRNIAHILQVVQKSPVFAGYSYSNEPPLGEHAAVAREAAAEGMVLLKNDAALPLVAETSLSLFGSTSYDIITGGTGSGDVNEAYSVSLRQGLKDAGFEVDSELGTSYERFIEIERRNQPPTPPFMLPPPLAEMNVSIEYTKQLAARTDLAVITIGRNSGEIADRKAEEDFTLTKAEQDLIHAVGDAYHAVGKKVVVVLNIGGVIETASWRDQVDAILLAWQPGQEAGHAIADVLSGKVNPSGKLATSFSEKLSDYPSAENFPGVVSVPRDPEESPSIFYSDKAAAITYSDSVWVGYRHFNSNDVPVAYPFGYGLSYTYFSYSDAGLNGDRFDDELRITVTISNNGKVAGKEVVQIYLAAPPGKLEKPAEELRAFGKTGLLEPGESEIMTFTISARDLMSFDVLSRRWIADAGEYAVRIGASSSDIRSELPFTLEQPIELTLP